ncbi:PREDICTED: tubulin-folding cofactor C-like [Camelina sativa]|uniref:Tubulin-folding cofactor C-like n=1 Tax=Camelina sativa TaxID=90675 RepID=A0ABM0UUI7_CAMSA|nr:PREDICTED: tubulin-folding cofactor C-like [Camelina sativa]
MVMEDDDPETLDPALQKKHHDMLERLSARHQARKSDLPDTSSSSSTLESTSSFLAKFSDAKRSIESRIAESRLVSSSSSSSATDSSKLKSDLADISSAINNLEKLLAENSYFLPSYEVRSSLKIVSDLKQSLESLSAELIPKKKFSFKSKSTTKKLPEIQKPGVVSPPPNVPVPVPVRDSPGLRNKHGETLVKSFKGSSIGEFTLSDLDSCQVQLTGTVNALFLHRLKNCNVYTGPVVGSILIDDVQDCVLVLASHQIRIHCARKSDFYLRVRSRPIIEDSNGVRFAPYCLDYQGIEEDLKKAGLDEETKNWSNVDDFKWLRAVQSPNWSVLPEEERVSSVSISR